MNQSQNVNFVVKRNDTIKWTLTIKQDGAVVDITGWAFFFTVKTSVDDADAAALIKVDWSSHSDPTNGVTILTVPKESTNQTGQKVYDLQYKNGAGEIHTILWGNLTFDKDITLRTS